MRINRTSRRLRVTTRLSASEARDFKRVHKFVNAYCGLVSKAEVLRYLVRDWAKWR